ncbi:mitotic checkpoint regulator, MAD2B-interacting-domain-containing protein [Thelonectria olida]|uniref:Mitotic checkpoint regulator, MAD2B-interacting-domain-containing protein n=1 Tax=Thelonectria olida TaxID=1576542 RepID=A0A9P9AMI8_9HYPO|nr:mitotic checkpoint regulator, MAD2B-interacting-domain-containing protein [Thelonectria olida]
MGLVDYSDSEGSGSEAEAPAKAPPKTSQPSSKKPFQKVVDRSNPGKIVVNLPQLSAESSKSHGDEPPAKRAKTGGSGLFSGFNSFLPAPKNTNKPKPTSSTSSSGLSRLGINLKTSAAPGFSRSTGYEDDADTSSGGMVLPPPKAAQPTIPSEQKPEEEVKLVGKPLMFKPLSVSRNPKKKKPTAAAIAKAAAQSYQPPTPSATSATESKAQSEPAPAPPKVSLFSLHTEEPSEPAESSKKNDTYQPMFETQSTEAYDSNPYGDYVQYASHATTGPSATTAPGTESLDTVVDDLNLSAAQRRELFGRGGEGKFTAKNVINFSMDKEYQHNEEIRAAGEQEIYNPVRAVMGSGKTSLAKLVRNVHSQKEALEDGFAKGKTNRKEASSKYGW